jgi:hypothetical protein
VAGGEIGAELIKQSPGASFAAFDGVQAVEVHALLGVGQSCLVPVGLQRDRGQGRRQMPPNDLHRGRRLTMAGLARPTLRCLREDLALAVPRADTPLEEISHPPHVI